MASEDLLKKAVDAFNDLSPEQQAEMLEEQRQSWVRGNVGLSRDERGMTSPMMRALKIVRETNDKGRQALQAWADSKTRPTPVASISPDATGNCGELVTVEHQYWRDQTQEWLPTGFPDRYRKDGFSVRELVTRSQAVELLAAKDKTIALAETTMIEMHQDLNKLEADNAALTARVKELVAERDEALRGNRYAQLERIATKRAEALEAKLAAAEKALETIDWRMIFLAVDRRTRDSGESNTMAARWMAEEASKAVRAALEGKPS